MIKYIAFATIIAGFIILQACSKKNTQPIVTGYEGFWTGKIPLANAKDSIQFNLKLGGALDGKLFIGIQMENQKIQFEEIGQLQILYL